MTKKIILALALATAIAAIAVPSFASWNAHEQKEHNGTTCIFCKGTGRSSGGQGPYKCQQCGGTGWNYSY